jgi:hypothetical protein
MRLLANNLDVTAKVTAKLTKEVGSHSRCVSCLVCENGGVEKHLEKRSLREFRSRENPWIHASYIERLRGLTQIVFSENDHESAPSGFPRFHRIARSKRC